MKNRQIYLIRHGQTDLNKQGIVQGRGVNSDLNEIGIAQALAFYRAYKHICFKKIYISSLKRTFQSVENFINDGIPYQIFEGLDELGWGVWEGKRVTYESSLIFKKVLEKWCKGDLDAYFEEGESPRQVCQRQLPVIHQLENEKLSPILICMHGRAMRIFLCQLLKLPISSMDRFTHSNLTLYHLQYDGQEFRLINADDTDHLKYYW